MDYKKLAKDCESFLEELSKKKFDTLEEAFIEVTKQWELVLSQQSGRMLPLLKRSNVLCAGIVPESINGTGFVSLLRMLKLFPKKTLFCFSPMIIKEPLICLLKDAESLDDEIALMSDKILFMEKRRNLIEERKDYQPNQTEGEMIPISRFYRFAESYQRMLMHAIDIPDKDWAFAIRKDARAALYGQGMEVVDYDGTNDTFFEVREDVDCRELSMVSPAIIRRSDNKIIARGLVYKPYNNDFK